jgi:lysine 2,3-aminomutase
LKSGWTGTRPDWIRQSSGIREKNKERIIRVLAEKISRKEIRSPKFSFPEGLSKSEQLEMVLKWWDDHSFHLRFAVRTPAFLNELLDHTPG